MSEESNDLRVLMSKIDLLIDKISALLRVLEASAREHKDIKKCSRSSTSKSNFDPQQLRENWQQLKEVVLQGADASKVARDFVESHSKRFLEAFIKVNSLAISVKLPKDRIAEHLTGLLKANKAVIQGLA